MNAHVIRTEAVENGLEMLINQAQRPKNYILESRARETGTSHLQTRINHKKMSFEVSDMMLCP